MFGRKARLIKRLQDELNLQSERRAYRHQRGEAEIDNWIETARHFASGVDYYKGLLDQIAGNFGIEAYLCDDGSIADRPLRAKIPELVSDLRRRLHYYQNQHPVIEAEFIFIEAVNHNPRNP